MRTVVQCILVYMVYLPEIDNELVEIWKLFVKLDEFVDRDSFTENDLVLLAELIQNVSS
jgi:hypothetical protein